MEACKRCLLYELVDGDDFKGIYEYIEGLPEEIKADSATYDRRIALCRACDSLVNGMCRLCGCFVETRAAKKVSRCAAPQEKW